MKSTLIIVLFLLVLPRNALFCKGFLEFCEMLQYYSSWQIGAELSKSLSSKGMTNQLKMISICFYKALFL